MFAVHPDAMLALELRDGRGEHVVVNRLARGSRLRGIARGTHVVSFDPEPVPQRR
jgi:hypothetical protein